MPVRMALASRRLVAARTASARRAALRIAASQSKRKNRPPVGVSSTVRRPSRIDALPVSPRAQRQAIALASVGTASTARPRRSIDASSRPSAPRLPPAAHTSAIRARTSAGVSSPSQPMPKIAPVTGRPIAGAAASSTASASGLPRPASSPWASTSPPTSSSTTWSQPSRRAASPSASPTARGPGPGSTSTTSWPVSSATRDSAKRKPPGPVVSGPASATASLRTSAPDNSSRARGPGSGSTGRRSQVSPPTTASRSRSAAASAHASAPTTSPPPPMPTTSRRVAGAKMPASSGEGGNRACGGDDLLDLLAGAVELVVGQDRGALERQVARNLQPRPAAAEVLLDLDGHGARDPVGAQENHVQRVAPLPGQPLLGVVGSPDVVRRQRVDRPGVGDRPVRGHLGPGTDAHPVGLGDAAVLGQRLDRRLSVGPDTLFEGARQLGPVGGPHEVVALVVKGRIEEETVVLEAKMPARLANSALAQGQKLLALGERADGDRPL